jgi:propanol-preferring alcohol dehydrogenase
MKAMVLRQTGVLREGDRPLQLVDVPVPVPQEDEILVHVSTCGVCRTELDEIEGRTAPSQLPIVLGHQIVGTVADRGPRATKHNVGDRVGVGWIHSSSGGRNENLSTEFKATGRDVNGGYAEYVTVSDEYAYLIPGVYSDEAAAPLLCAGAIGWRALQLTNLENGQRLGLTGFGSSAHLVLQLAQHVFPNSSVFVFARDRAQRCLAEELGAMWSGDTFERSPERLHAIIDTTPAWTPVVEALGNLEPGGRLVINAIRKEDADKDALLRLSYHEHLWMEREIKSVANITHHDIAEFLPLAAEAGLKPVTQHYPLEAANQALSDLKFGRGCGSKVLCVRPTSVAGYSSRSTSLTWEKQK